MKPYNLYLQIMKKIYTNKNFHVKRVVFLPEENCSK